MNVITDMLFLFIVLLILFYFNIPNIENDNFIFHKLIIFVIIFIFSYLTNLIKKLNDKESKVTNVDLIYKSFEMSIGGIVGYSLFIDLMIMESTQNIVNNLIQSRLSLQVTVSFVVTMFITMIKVVKMLFNNSV